MNKKMYSKYTFQGQSGWIAPQPSRSDVKHKLFSIGHTALVKPWTDSDVHIHTASEEYYLLMHGTLWFIVADAMITLRAGEILALKPHVPHAIIKGEGTIEHFGVRAPFLDDKRVIGEIPEQAREQKEEEKRALRCDWGYRVPLASTENQNCWLFGSVAARYLSSYLCLAYLNFPTPEGETAGKEPRHLLQSHQQSWEYYVVLKGSKILQIEDRLLEIKAGEIVEIPPNTRHVLSSREVPYEGFTFRVPLLLDDKVEYYGS